MEKKSIDIIKEIFREEDAESKHTSFYEFGGWRQSRRKREYVEIARDLVKKRGV
ncbi:MAG TPA: hypothetical protein ENG09_06125, partial [Candidatus Syntrophoarchaeum butanivorans]|nr:hypothetical protein [Candidatus Syntrophoarchaeum butanivorans]